MELLETADLLDDSAFLLVDLIDDKILNNIQKVLFVQKTGDQNLLSGWGFRQILFLIKPSSIISFTEG